MIENFTQAFIVAFREGLEAFLIIAILLQFLNKSDNKKYKKNVWQGMSVGIMASLIFGGILWIISSMIGDTGSVAKLWESGASFIAVLLIGTFIVWMIKHGAIIKQHVEDQAKMNLSAWGIFLVAFIMVIREGAEISIFAFAGNYQALPLLAGLAASIVVVILIFYSIVKVNLSTIFNITLAYLILQAGFLGGYALHEGLSAAKDLGHIDPDHGIYTKAFDASSTVFNHKEGAVGIPLYVGIGWYSKPEWIQFILQYSITFGLFGYWYWYRDRKRQAAQQ